MYKCLRLGRYIGVAKRHYATFGWNISPSMAHDIIKLSVNSIFGCGGTDKRYWLGRPRSVCVCKVRLVFAVRRARTRNGCPVSCTLWWPRRKVFYIHIKCRYFFSHCMTINASAGCQLIKRKMHGEQKCRKRIFYRLSFSMKSNEMFTKPCAWARSFVKERVFGLSMQHSTDGVYAGVC